MPNQDAWQLAHAAAIAYEKDFVPAIFAQWPPVLAELVGMGPGDRVLDVGCGTGILAREAAGCVGPTGRVTGIDVNEAMLAVARELRPELEWRPGDAVEIPFPDGAFDVVVSQFALMFVPDRVAALREMWRVLAPRGRLAVAICAPITEGYLTLAAILRREVGERAAAMVEGYFALGDGTELRAARQGGRNRRREDWDMPRLGSLRLDRRARPNRDQGFAARRAR